MRILFVANVGSMHTTRWVHQLEGTGWDVHLFQPTLAVQSVHPELRYGTVHTVLPITNPSRVQLEVVRAGFFERLGRRLRPPAPMSTVEAHGRALAELVKRLCPTVVHSLGLHVNGVNQCEAVLYARALCGGNLGAPWIYSSWGSDLDYYARASPAQRREVEEVLASCDYYVAETERDRRLAQELGLKAKFAGCLPAFGGVDAERVASLRRPGPPSLRRGVFLKGRDHGPPNGDPVGRAMVAMRGFECSEELLRGHRVVVGTPTLNVAAEEFSLFMNTGLETRVAPYLAYDDVLHVIGASRIVVSLTVNDGLSSTLVEAMALGALPLFSDLEPVREWIKDGINGLLVLPEDVDAFVAALRRAITDDALIDRAAEINARVVRERLTREVVRPRTIALYEGIAAHRLGGPERSA